MDQEAVSETYFEDLREALETELAILAEPVADMPSSFVEGEPHARVQALVKALIDDLPKPEPLPKNGRLFLPANLMALANAEGPTYYFIDKLSQFFRDQYTYAKALRSYSGVLRSALTAIDVALREADKARQRYTGVQNQLRARDVELAALKRQALGKGNSGTPGVVSVKPNGGGQSDAEIIADLREQVSVLQGRLERLQTAKATAPTSETQESIIPHPAQCQLSNRAPRISFWNALNSPADFQNIAAQFPRIFSRRDELAEYARFHLEGRLALSDRAEKELAGSVYRDVPLMYFSLMLLAYDYRDMAIAVNGDRQGLVSRFQRKAMNLGVTEAKSTGFKTQNEMPGEYMTSYDGRSYFLDRALKKGASHKPETTFRCYFALDKERQLIVVGSMPRHLRNTHGD